MQRLLANSTNSALELTRNLRGRRLLPGQRLKGLYIVLVPGPALDLLLWHISSRKMSAPYITVIPALRCRLFNVAMRTQYFVAGLSQIEAITTHRQHSVVELGWTRP